MKDDEGTEVSGEEIKQSMEQAFVRLFSYRLGHVFTYDMKDADSPKDAQEHEEAVAKGEETSAESSETDSQESTDSAPSEADSAPSEEKQEVASKVDQPESPANTEASEASQEAAVSFLVLVLDVYSWHVRKRNLK
jgi:cytoskeletal protein RodZ